jgi:hypothetical protein
MRLLRPIAALAALATACTDALPPGGPTLLSAPASFPWRTVANTSFRYGLQPSLPALDGSGGLILAGVSYSNPQCPQARLERIQPAPITLASAAALWSTPFQVPGLCVSLQAVALVPVADPVVSPSAGGGVALTAFPAGPNASSGLSPSVAVVAAAVSTGAQAWTAVLPQSALLGPLTPVANATLVAVLVGTSSGANTTAVVLRADTGAVVASLPLPAGSPGCNGSLTSVDGVAAGVSAAGEDVLFVSGRVSTFGSCAMAWVMTGVRAGQVVWGLAGAPGTTPSPSWPPLVDAEAPAAGVFLLSGGSSSGGGSGLTATSVSADTGSVVWTAQVSPDETVVTGAGLLGGALFVSAGVPVWRGCSAPGPTLYALDSTNGSMINAMALARYPDMGVDGSLVVGWPTASSPELLPPRGGPRGAGVELYIRETNGWGTFDSYVTAVTFSGSYYLITASYAGAPSGALGVGTNVAHDDSTTGVPVHGCPVSLDETPGNTGALVIGPGEGQLLVVDWAGVQIFGAAGGGGGRE